MGQKSIFYKNENHRKDALSMNNLEYRLFKNGVTNTPIGSLFVVSNPNNMPLHENSNGLLEYTYGEKSRYRKELNEKYGRDIDSLNMYVISNTKPSYKVNDYEGERDYIKYISDIYGKEESYAGHLLGLANVKDAAQHFAYDIFPDAEGKTFADYINEIRQFGDVKYAMEKDSVGIVRDIRVAEALGGAITTNINNYSGKDTRLGMISNLLYANSLLRGAEFNSMRRTKYITDGLDTVYGDNLSNIHNLSSLFLLNEETGRFNDVSSEKFIGYMGQPLGEYTPYFIKDFKLPDNSDVWNKGYHYNKSYYDTKLTEDGWKSENSVSGGLYQYYKNEGGHETNGDYDELKDVHFNSFSDVELKINNGENLLNKTRKLFEENKIRTMLGRYFIGDNNDKTQSLIQSSVDPTFGISRGRNLLSKNAWYSKKGGNVGGYENPYCRAWTYHHQYSKMRDLIRPFTNSDGEFLSIDKIQKKWGLFRPKRGEWGENSVINKNGMVNITPSKGGDEVKIEKCMFSIENLAWRDAKLKFTEGPNKGRIMWFPPYDIEFSENVSVNWEEMNFIGRGEPLSVYKNTKRTGTLSFTLLVDHPAILDYWMLNKKKNATPDDEQTALRFFAGCETIDPAFETIEQFNSLLEGGDVNFRQKNDNEDDIIFHVFYPFGCTADLDKIVKGNLKDKEWVNIDEVKALLGYEMGSSPISSVYSKEDEPISIKDKLELSEFITETDMDGQNDKQEIEITWDEFIKKDYDDFSKYNNASAVSEGKTAEKKVNDDQNEDIDKEITRLTGLKAEDITEKNIQDEKWAEGSTMKNLKIQIEDKNISIKEKGELREKYNGFLKMIRSNFKQSEKNEKENGDIDKDNEKNSELIDRVKKFFKDKNVNQYFVKTNALFFYKGKDENNNKAFIPKDNASDAYIGYIKDNLPNQYKNLEEAKRKFFGEKEIDGINLCFIKNDKEYYKINIEGSNIEDILPTFSSKSEFKKSKDKFCLCKGKYLVKNGESIEEVSHIDDLKNYLTSYESDEKFMSSSDTVCVIKNTIKKKTLTKVENNGVEGEIKNIFPKKDDNIDEDEVAKKYFKEEKCLYESYEELDKLLKRGDKNVKYGYVQFFAKMKSDYHIYNSLQEFVIDSEIKIDYNNITKEENSEVKDEKYGYVKVDNEKCQKYKGELKYPVDSVQFPTSSDISDKKQMIDMESFGLNSTYELVQEYMQDKTITCTFGEFYAAYKGDADIIKFVLDCERKMLKLKKNYKNDELDKKIEEREKYINSLKTKLENEIRGVKINSSEKSSSLLNTRIDGVETFLKGDNLLKNGKFINNKEEEVSEGTNESIENINSIDNKKNRNCRVQIVRGLMDDTENSSEKEDNDFLEGEKNHSYGNEELFFSLLTENDSIAYKQLVDKVRFFSPAFHSMTPEGFNERLTFLHQCTRQGGGLSYTDGKQINNNMVFGKPPFCVLRIGDFINSYINIESLSISYPDSKWDFNVEGIGAQFMMAKVQMGINIFGGSDITGAVNSLQNALAFNFYANTSVYHESEIKEEKASTPTTSVETATEV